MTFDKTVALIVCEGLLFDLIFCLIGAITAFLIHNKGYKFAQGCSDPQRLIHGYSITSFSTYFKNFVIFSFRYEWYLTMFTSVLLWCYFYSNMAYQSSLSFCKTSYSFDWSGCVCHYYLLMWKDRRFFITY